MSVQQMSQENFEEIWVEQPRAEVVPLRRRVPGYPTNLRHEHLHRLFDRHPELRGTDVAFKAENLYEGVTWNV